VKFCPECGHDLRGAVTLAAPAAPAASPSGPWPFPSTMLVERAPTVTEQLAAGAIKREPVREDFPLTAEGERAWWDHVQASSFAHQQSRVDAARAAWTAAYGHEPDDDQTEAVIRWYLATAKADGAANATLLREWRAAGGQGSISDKDLLAWKQEQRRRAQGEA
jgi:hypothetical protein